MNGRILKSELWSLLILQMSHLQEQESNLDMMTASLHLVTKIY